MKKITFILLTVLLASTFPVIADDTDTRIPPPFYFRDPVPEEQPEEHETENTTPSVEGNSTPIEEPLPEEKKEPNNIVTFVSLGIVLLLILIVIFVLDHLKNKKPKRVLKTTNHELINYINSVLKKGYSHKQIKLNLSIKGYEDEEINMAFHHLRNPTKPKNKKL